MSKYRESIHEHIEIDFEDIDCLEKLSDMKKITDRQRKTLKKFIQWYFQVVD